MIEFDEYDTIAERADGCDGGPWCDCVDAPHDDAPFVFDKFKKDEETGI